ncbi:MAG: anti-sigma factor family protein [Terriglobales bacterium]
MDCSQIVLHLSSYLDGESSPELQAHVAGCASCRLVVESCQQTIGIYRRQLAPPLPAELHRRVIDYVGRRVPPGRRVPHPSA